MKRTLAILALGISIGLTGCSTFYERGQKVASIGSNVENFEMSTPAGTRIKASRIDNAIIHREAGNNVTKTGVSVATSGLLGFLGSLFK